MVDIKADRKLDVPVTLEMIKAMPGLDKMVLVNNSRLSVQPVTAEEWRTIVEVGTGESITYRA